MPPLPHPEPHPEGHPTRPHPEPIYDIVGRAGERPGGSHPAPTVPAATVEAGIRIAASAGHIYSSVGLHLPPSGNVVVSAASGTSARLAQNLVAGSHPLPASQAPAEAGGLPGQSLPTVSASSHYMSVHSPLGIHSPYLPIDAPLGLGGSASPVPGNPASGGAPVSSVSPAAHTHAAAAYDVVSASATANPSVGLFRRNRCVLVTAGLVSVIGGVAASVYAALAAKTAAAGHASQENMPPTTPPTAPPPVPTGLRVQPQSATSLLITWDLLMLTVSVEYVVKRDGREIGTTPSRVNSFMDRNLQPGARHCYTVAARNEAGASADSAEACARTLNQPPGTPGTPTDLAGLPLSLHGIRLSWASSPGAESYIVQRRLSMEGGYTEVATVPATHQQMVFDDHGLEQGVQYCYSVVAENAAGRSAPAQFLCLSTYDDCDVFAAEVVAKWNQLPEESYWDKMIVWVREDAPDLECQWVVANFSLGIADMTTPGVLKTEQAIQDVVDSMLAAEDAANDIVAVYQALKVLVAGRGDPVPRYEKLNVLSRTLANLIAHP